MAVHIAGTEVFSSGAAKPVNVIFNGLADDPRKEIRFNSGGDVFLRGVSDGIEVYNTRGKGMTWRVFGSGTVQLYAVRLGQDGQREETPLPLKEYVWGRLTATDICLKAIVPGKGEIYASWSPNGAKER